MPRFNITCRECQYTDDHAEWCQSRGYAFVGPHPDAPAPDTVRSPADPNAPLEMCCGGTTVRAVCVYHGPKVDTKADRLAKAVSVSVYVRDPLSTQAQAVLAARRAARAAARGSTD